LPGHPADHPGCRRLAAAARIAYLHLVEADWDDAPEITEAFRQQLRERFTNPIIVAGNYDKARAQWVLEHGYADLVAFGRPLWPTPISRAA
jgi:N-ethylmaleimide reductase